MSLLLLLLSGYWLSFGATRSAPPYLLEHAELHFESFIQKYNKDYKNQNEKQDRFQIFKDNLVKVNEMNDHSDNTVFGITKFMDLTSEEFVNLYANAKISASDELAASACQIVTDDDVIDTDIPEKLNWYWSGVEPPVMDQGICIAGYAFSAISNIESMYAMQYTEQIQLSQQQIIDCDRRSQGCSGGNTLSAFRSIIEQGGVETLDDYPYIEDNGNECKFNRTRVKVKVKDCYSYNLHSHEKVQQVVFQNGPISIAVRAANFQFYLGGVMDDALCNHGEINHSLLIVGYGRRSLYFDKPYWEAMNSWGEDWGLGGHIYLQRGGTSTACGMMNPFMSTAVIEK